MEKKPKLNTQISKKKFLELRPKTAASFLAKKLKFALEQKDKASLENFSELASLLDYAAHIPSNFEEAYYFLLDKAGHNFGPLRLHTAFRDLALPRHPPISWKVALNSFRSGHNVGSVFRLADAFCFEEILLGGYCPGPENKAVAAAAMGAEAYVPFKKEMDLAAFLKSYAKEYPLFALEIAEDALELGKWNPPPKGILLLGNEERGIEKSCLKLCEKIIKIPLYGRKHSLNVSTSFAIAAQHIFASMDH